MGVGKLAVVACAYSSSTGGTDRQIPRARWLAGLANEKTVTEARYTVPGKWYLRFASLTSTQTVHITTSGLRT